MAIDAGKTRFFLEKHRHTSKETPCASGGNFYENNVPFFEFAGRPSIGEDNTKKYLRASNSKDSINISAHHLSPPFSASPLPVHWQLDENYERSKLPSAQPQGEFCNTSLSRSINQACRWFGADNKYELQGLLGNGTFSKVYHIYESESMLSYALKVISKNPDRMQWRQLDANHYESEIRIHQSCRAHANVISLHQVMCSATHVFMVLELAAGGDLFDRLKTQGHFSKDQSRHTLNMILEGVLYLHSNGITHRDLKLENLLYKSRELDSKILISDFGLAHQRILTPKGCDLHQRSYDHLDGCGMSTTCGTAEYLSPEMLGGEEYSEKVDIWAVGVVMYAIMSGKMPFLEEEGGGRARMYRRIIEGVYSLEDEVRSDMRWALSGHLYTHTCTFTFIWEETKQAH